MSEQNQKVETNTPAAIFIARNNVMTFGAKKGVYMPIGRCMDDMCACIEELADEACRYYVNSW